jgi:hypothetical protein
MKDDWTNANKKDITSYYNIIKKSNPEIIMDDYYFLEDNYEILEEYYKDNAAGTKKKLYSLLYKYFTFRHNENKSTKYLLLKKYFEKMFKTETKEINEKKMSNEEQDDINYDLYITRDQINDKIKSYESIKFRTIGENIEYLLLNIIYNGALRTSFYEKLKIASNKSNIPENENYIYVNSKVCYYYVELDKVSNSAMFKLEERKKIIFEEEFKNIVYASVQKFPRTYLFNNWSEEKINGILKEIFKRSDVNISYFRKVYETCTYVDAIITGKMRQWMENCHKLRHSSNVAMDEYVQNYKKVPLLKRKMRLSLGDDNDEEEIENCEESRQKNEEEYERTKEESDKRKKEKKEVKTKK